MTVAQMFLNPEVDIFRYTKSHFLHNGTFHILKYTENKIPNQSQNIPKSRDF
jgi:hypothetical protein